MNNIESADLSHKNEIFENLCNCKNKFEDKISQQTSLKWLTSKEAAQYLRISISSLKMMIYRGQVRVRKLGRRNRFLKDELDSLFIFSELKKGK